MVSKPGGQFTCPALPQLRLSLGQNLDMFFFLFGCIGCLRSFFHHFILFQKQKARDTVEKKEIDLLEKVSNIEGKQPYRS